MSDGPSKSIGWAPLALIVTMLVVLALFAANFPGERNEQAVMLVAILAVAYAMRRAIFRGRWS